MKLIVRLWLVVMALTVFGGMAEAQNHRQRITRERLAEAQARHMAEEMHLDSETSKRLVDTYCRFQKEIWALGPRPKQANPSVMTDEEAGRMIKSRFAHSRKILDLRQKYYAIYSEFQTQKQILRVYVLEKQMMNRLARHDKRPSRPRLQP